MKPLCLPYVRLTLALVLGLSVLLSCSSSKPAARTPDGLLPIDARTDELLRMSQQYLRLNNYTPAINLLNEASQRPLSRSTTAVLYLLGFAQQQSGGTEAALEAYQRLVSQFPQSQYVPEANYHKALLLLNRPEQREAALWLLLNLAERAERTDLRADATAAANQFLFDKADADFLTRYQEKVRASWRPRVTEALVHRLQRDGQPLAVQRVLMSYQKSGGELTTALRRLIGELPTAGGVRQSLRVAVVLPFLAMKQDSTFDVTSSAALEMLQGIRLAVDSMAYPGLTSVELKVLDSNDDSLEVALSLVNELKLFEPHIVIGDLRNRPSRALARAAAQYGWLHLVPISDADELITAATPNTVLANPSQGTTAERLGQHTRRWNPTGRVIVAHDPSAASRRLAERFTAQLAGTALRVEQRTLSNFKDLFIEQFKEFSARLRVDSADVVYLPIHNEEYISFALYRLSNDSVNVQVYGLDRWRSYTSLDPEMLSRLKAIVPDLYGEPDQAQSFERFRGMYVRAFRALPTTYSIQGFDVARMVLTAIGRSRPDATPLEALQSAPTFKGLNKPYRFGPGARDNQLVPLVEYRFGQASRVPQAE